MKHTIKHTVVVGLTVGYLTVTLLGHLEVLAHLVNTGGESPQVTSEKQSRPIDSRPIWTQKKHLLLSTKNGDGLYNVACTNTRGSYDLAFFTICIPRCVFPPAKSVYLPYRPRDPPSA